jgi:hypothetical protein
VFASGSTAGLTFYADNVGLYEVDSAVTVNGKSLNYGGATFLEGTVSVGSVQTGTSALLVKGVGSAVPNILTLQDEGATAKFIVQNAGNVGINTTSPDAKLTVKAGATAADKVINVLSSSDASVFSVDGSGKIFVGGTTPTAYINSSGQLAATLVYIGTSTGYATALARSGDALTIGSAGVGAGGTKIYGGAGPIVLDAAATNTQTSASSIHTKINTSYNQTSGTAANTDLLINRTETAVGSGTQRLISAQVGSVEKFAVDNKGSVTQTGSIKAITATSTALSLTAEHSTVLVTGDTTITLPNATSLGTEITSGAWTNTYTTAFDTFTSTLPSGFTATTATAKSPRSLVQVITLVQNTTYRISGMAIFNGGTVTLYYGNNSYTGGLLIGSITSGVAFAFDINNSVAAQTGIMLLMVASGASSITVSNFSVKALTGESNSGRLYTVKKMDASGTTTTISTTSSQTIDGQTSKQLSAQYESITLQSTGSEWVIL